jgi:predicted transposase YbfD/YdcC
VPLKGNQGNTQRLSRGKYIESILSGAMIQKHVDLNDHDAESIPGKIIQVSMINVKEDNDTGTQYASEGIGIQPDVPPKDRKTDAKSRNIEDDIKVGLLTSSLMLDQIDESELCPSNKTLVWAKVPNGYIKMAKAHGRYERREYWIINLTEESKREFLGENNLWACVQALGLAVRFRSEDIAKYWIQRERKSAKNEPVENLKITVTGTPYVLSCCIDVEEFAQIARKHWSVEKGHMIGDVTHVEDQLRIKGRYGPENYSWMKKMGHNFLSIVRAYERTSGIRIDGEKHYPMSYSAQQEQLQTMPGFIAPFINEPIKSPYTQESFHPIKLVKAPQ